MKGSHWIVVTALAAAAVLAFVMLHGPETSESRVEVPVPVGAPVSLERDHAMVADPPVRLEQATVVSKVAPGAPTTTADPVLAVGGHPNVSDVARPPRLCGRIVFSTRQPAKHVTVSAQVFEVDGSSTSTEVKTESDGRFAIPLADDQFRDCEIHARRDEYFGLRLDVRFLRRELDPSLDVGDLAFPSEAEMTLHVVGSAGVPLVDAVAGGQHADKHGDCRIGPEWQLGSDVRVDAPGYWSVSVAVPKPLVDRQDVQLSPCNRFAFHFSGIEADAAGLLSVRILDTGRPLCADADGSWGPPERDCVLLGSVLGSFSDVRARSGTEFRPNEAGDLVLEGLDPSIAIEFYVQDPLGTRVQEAKLTPLGRAGRRDVDIPLAGRAHELVVCVRDSKGKPLPGSEVLASAQDGSETKLTGADGKYRFPLLFANQVDLEARNVGYARAARRSVQLVQPVEYVEFQLERGRRVTVDVVDARSRFVDGGTLRASSPDTGISWKGWPTGKGKFAIEDLPAEGDVLLSLELGGRVYEKRHDPNVPVARFDVPVHGRVEVKWSLAPGSEAIERVLALRSTEVDGATVWGPPTLDVEGEWAVESVHPGTYDAMLLREGKDDSWIAVLPVRRITVAADRTVSVSLRP